MRTLFKIFCAILGMAFPSLDLCAERIDTTNVIPPLDPDEIWFHADGFDFSAKEGETECVVRDANYELVGCMTGSYWGDVVVPAYVEEDGVQYTVVGIQTMKFCFVKSISLPNTIRWIKGMDGLYDLVHLEIPESVEWIDGCSLLYELRSLVLPATPVDLTQAFSELISLQEVMANSPEPYPVGQWTFDGVYGSDLENCVLVVPDESIDKYRQAPRWCEFGTIVGRSGYTGVTPTLTAAPYTIKAVPNGFEVKDYSGKLSVHDLTGKLVTECDVNQACSISLPSGAYVIRTSTSVHKMLVK